MNRKEAAKLFAESFYDDDLFSVLFPDKKNKLQAMTCYYEVYLRMYQSTGELYTTSDEMEGVLLIFPPLAEKKLKYLMDFIIGGCSFVRLLRYVSLKQWLKLIETTYRMSSTWIEEVLAEPYLHLDMMSVRENARGKGFGKQLITFTLSEGKRYGVPVTVETQNKSNVPMYEKFGFELVKKVSFQQLVAYCFVCRTDKDVNQ